MKFVPRSWRDVPSWIPIAADAINGLLRAERNILPKTAAYTITEGDDVVLADATGGAFSVILPKATLFKGRQFWVKKVDASGNAVTIDGDGSETIDGAATLALAAQWDNARLLSTGTAWLKF
jgi:hypothetical protein